jgi:hypothetical protein
MIARVGISLLWFCVVHISVLVFVFSTYIHTYIHTYVRTYIHIHIRTYIHTYIHTYQIPLCMFLYVTGKTVELISQKSTMYVPVCSCTYIQLACIHTDIHTFRRTCSTHGRSRRVQSKKRTAVISSSNLLTMSIQHVYINDTWSKVRNSQ